MSLHTCGLCGRNGGKTSRFPKTSSGDVTLVFTNGRRWVMPDMILHYVADHGWRPDGVFINDVLNRPLESGSRVQTRGVGHVSGATRIGYLNGGIERGRIPVGFIEKLAELMSQAARMNIRIQAKGPALRGQSLR